MDKPGLPVQVSDCGSWGELPKNVNYDLVMRIAQIIQEGENLSKSRLASRCKMNYRRLSRYLNWMRMHQYVTIDKHVRLTETGAKFIRISNYGIDHISESITLASTYYPCGMDTVPNAHDKAILIAKYLGAR